jgi:UDP-N-acetylmuramoylalanine--D-glutamate ligase
MGGGQPQRIVALGEALALPGHHNAQNAAAAYAVARTAGVSGTSAASAMRTFPGLAHRQELVAVVDGIAYVNDSKATNADAAARALACYESVYWIAGGRPKESGLAALDPYLERVRHAFLIGEAAPAFAEELAGKVPLTRCGTLQNAVREATGRAAANGTAKATVLLSPACASFDQFRDFEERGETFRALVRALGR